MILAIKLSVMWFKWHPLWYSRNNSHTIMLRCIWANTHAILCNWRTGDRCTSWCWRLPWVNLRKLLVNYVKESQLLSLIIRKDIVGHMVIYLHAASAGLRSHLKKFKLWLSDLDKVASLGLKCLQFDDSEDPITVTHLLDELWPSFKRSLNNVNSP